MVFKRRNKRSPLQAVAEFIYPRGGWKRAIRYLHHRVNRLPDAPHRIARGIFCGVFASFTPFFGLHFVIAAVMARLMRGNIVAALLATFVGNPLTFPIIAAVNLKLGQWILGRSGYEGADTGLWHSFAEAGREFWRNFRALFTNADTDWTHLSLFYDEVMLPYLVGGLVPGLITSLAFYYASVPVISAYQNRRRGRLEAKLAELRRKSARKAAEKAAGKAARKAAKKASGLPPVE